MNSIFVFQSTSRNKIQKTNEQASQVASRKEQRAEKTAALNAIHTHQYAKMHQQRHQNQAARDKNREGIREAKKAFVGGKHAEAAAMRQSKQAAKRELEQKQDEIREANRLRAMKIREDREERKRLADQERQVAVSNYQERIVMEDMLRSKTEQLVAQMEREELELIRKLYSNFFSIVQTSNDDSKMKICSLRSHHFTCESSN